MFVGAALAKAERDRRSARAKRSRERKFAQLSDEQPIEGLQRMAVGQLDIAIEHLAGERQGKSAVGAGRAVHETRKSLKRLRTLLRLLANEVDEQALALEENAVRDAARRLAGARDAEVLVETLDGLLERHPRKLARRKSVHIMRERLVAEREREAARIHQSATRMEVLAELRCTRARIARWTLADGGPDIAALEPGLDRVYRQGRRRYRRAASGRGDRARAMHQWRKRVKDLRYACEALQRADPVGKQPGARKLAGAGKRAPVSKRERRRANAAASQGERHLRELARRADELGELLGEEHDLAMLAERVRAERKRPAKGRVPIGRGAQRTLLKLIARRRRRLRALALGKAERLYRRRPKKFVRRVRRAHRQLSLR